jgi:hypothetical protein
VIATLRRRPAVAAAVFYAIVVIALFAPGLLPGKTLSSSDTLWFDAPWLSSKPADLMHRSNPDLGDGPEYVQPMVRQAADAFPHVRLWDPYIAGGRPFLANSQSGIFSPYNLPAYVLPFWTALAWIAVLKLWVAAFGTYLLGRAIGMRCGGALLAGAVFALSLKSVTWVIYPTMGVWALIPWLLLATERFVRRPGLLPGSAIAAIVAIQIVTGHPESTFHSLIAVLAFFSLRAWQARGSSGLGGGRLTLAFCGALIGGAALGAVTLVPLGELIWLSADLRERAGESIDVHLPLKDAIGIFMPDYWGRPTQVSTRPILLERALYVGALPLMLAAAALVIRPRLERVWIALFGAVCFAVVLGIPPFVQVVTRLPIFSSGHNTRLIILPILTVALLAGWGLDDVAEGRPLPRSRRCRTLVVAAGLLVLPAAYVVLGRRAGLSDLADATRVAWLFKDLRDISPLREGVMRLGSLISWLTFAVLGVALIALRFRDRLAATAFVALALLLVVLDLFHIDMGQNPAIDREFASQPATGAIRYLERRRPARFAATDEVPQNVIPLRFRLYEARGYDPPNMRRYDKLWRREVVGVGPTIAAGLANIPLRLPDVTPRGLRTLRLLGVRYLLRGKQIASFDPTPKLTDISPLERPGLTEVYNGSDARVYRVSGALPRAFVVGGQQVVSGADAALNAFTKSGFDARALAITERRIAGLPERPARGEAARIVTYAPERVLIRARSSGPGLLVLGDNYFPGWKATVDGTPAKVERVDYVFRGVRIGPGPHTVELRYEPLSYRVGWIISLVSLISLAEAVMAGLRRRSRRRSPAPGR